MGLGLMNKKAKIISITRETDSEGFSFENVEVLAEVRVFVEGRHGSERWANLAAFSEATELFKLRKIPTLKITTKHYVELDGTRYNILSIENVKGRGMYIEILAKRVEASNG
jgi:SPP1 family predicted phage head-tail adaptor